MRRAACLPLLFWATLLELTSAQANGRPPAVTRLAFHPSDPDRLAVQATFGVVSSDDAGVSWQWTCEQAIGYTAVFDPLIVWSDAGLVLSLPAGGLVASSDGCQFTPPAGVDEVLVGDLQLHP